MMRYIMGSRRLKFGLARSILARSVIAPSACLPIFISRKRRMDSCGGRSRKGEVAGTLGVPRRLATSSALNSQTYAFPLEISSLANSYIWSK